MKYYIYSYRQSAWWRANESGYCNFVEDAGMYDKAQAQRIVFQGLPGGTIAVDEILADEFLKGKYANDVEAKINEWRRI